MPTIESFAGRASSSAARRFAAFVVAAWFCSFAISAKAASAGPKVISLLSGSPWAVPAVQQTSLPAGTYSTRTARVRLRFMDAPLHSRGSPTWTYTISIQVTPINGTQSGPPQTASLTISRDPTHDTFESVAVFPNFSASTVELAVDVTNPNTPPVALTGTPPSDLQLQLELTGEDSTALDVTHKPWLKVNPNTGAVFFKSVPAGAVSYELEWVFFDELEPQVPDPFAARDPVRMSTTDHNVQLDLSYPTGTLFIRGRALGLRSAVPPASPELTPGQWSDSVLIPITANALAPTLNWGYGATYAQGSDVASRITFFDGSLRARQSQSRQLTRGERLISGTQYDGEGRGSITFLPAPRAGAPFQFEPAYNQTATHAPNGSVVYDNDAFEGRIPPAVTNTSGAGNYYSPQGPRSTAQDAYVPDAQGYPFTFSQHNRDETRRLRAKSSAGAPLRYTGTSDRAVHFRYGTASSTPLRQLFGHNVGRANYYERNVTIDANGQAHIAYLDRQGRTIATALSGAAPPNVLSVRDLTSAPELTTYHLEDNNRIDLAAGVSRSVDHVTVEETTALFFQYQLNPVDYGEPAAGNDPAFCADCSYHLSIHITGPDGSSIPLRPNSTFANDPNCSTNPIGIVDSTLPTPPASGALACTVNGATSPTVVQSSHASTVQFCSNLPAGEYEVVKELTADQSSVDSLVTQLNATPGYFQPVDFNPKVSPPSSRTAVTVAEGMLSAGQCQADCTQFCNAVPDGPSGSYQHDAHSQCLAQCESPGKWTISSVAGQTCKTLASQLTADVAVGGILQTSPPGDVTRHPEYCHIKDLISKPTDPNPYLHSICGRTEQSDEFDYRMMAASADEAVCRGYFDPLGIGAAPAALAPASCTTPGVAVEHDPFFDPTQIGTSMQSWVAATMQDYSQAPGFTDAWTNQSADPVPHQSLWDMASTATTADQRWSLFRSLYLGLKQMALAQHLTDSSGGDYCPYWPDPHAHIKKPDFISTIDAASAAATQDLKTFCQSSCAARATEWVASLETACRTKLPHNTQVQMSNSFQQYCSAHCSSNDPIPMLTASDIAQDAAHHGPLSKISALLRRSRANCSLDAVTQNQVTNPKTGKLWPGPPFVKSNPEKPPTIGAPYQFAPATPNSCSTTVSKAATDAAQELSSQQGYIAATQARDQFDTNVRTTHFLDCLGPQLKESFSYQALPGEYVFTLRYYDQAGDLVQTVPPEGVHPLNAAAAETLANGGTVADPDHTLLSQYAYNSLGQVRWQLSPDAGAKRFWYNVGAQLRLSQDAQQSSEGHYAYLKYDARARLIESGVVTSALDSSGSPVQLDPSKLQTYAEDANFPEGGQFVTEQVVATSYDLAPQACGGASPRNLRGRVAAVIAASTLGAITTCYSYDPHGNVEWLSQDIPGLGTKTIAYDYDILDGHILATHYQPNDTDHLDHRYIYDRDQRITAVETSRDGELWERDATYNYYRHGPIARLELGADRVQGLDFLYTLRGWPKGVNSDQLDPTRDPGGDGSTNNSNSVVVPADVFGSAVHYFPGDYIPVDHSKSPDFTFADITGPTPVLSPLAQAACPDGSACGFYDGNIAAATHAAPGLAGSPMLATAYQYDQLYRLRSAVPFTDPNNSGDPHLWSTALTYDQNGNILTLLRFAPDPAGAGVPVLMDNLSYVYPRDSQNRLTSNRLLHIHDTVASNLFADDLDDQGPFDPSHPANSNYGYDFSGRMTLDRASGLNAINWNAEGRVTTITRANDGLEFVYDGLGNRIAKLEQPSSDAETWSIDYFVRNTRGDILATYHREPVLPTAPASSPALCDETLFGAGHRLGVWGPGGCVHLLVSTSNPAVHARTRGNKQYELTDYLGNVAVTITDRKQDVAGSGAITHYAASMLNRSDFDTFGSLLPTRSVIGSPYLYGFSGLEKDDDLKGQKGQGDSYYTAARLFDPRVGRWLSVDPLPGDGVTPYAGFADNPLRYADPSGTDDEPRVGDPILRDFEWKPPEPESQESFGDKLERNLKQEWDEGSARLERRNQLLRDAQAGWDQEYDEQLAAGTLLPAEPGQSGAGGGSGSAQSGAEGGSAQENCGALCRTESLLGPRPKTLGDLAIETAGEAALIVAPEALPAAGALFGRLPQVAVNRMIGEQAVDDFVASATANGMEAVGREVSVETPFGIRRYDVVIRDSEGRLHGVEIKSSQGAFNRFDHDARRQFAADRWVNQLGGAKVVGSGPLKGQTIESASKLLWLGR